MAATHLHEDTNEATACGRSFAVVDTTTDPQKVTCSHCRNTGTYHRAERAQLMAAAKKIEPASCKGCGIELLPYNRSAYDGRMCADCYLNGDAECTECGERFNSVEGRGPICDICANQQRRAAALTTAKELCHTVESNADELAPIPHDTAHDMADLAYKANEYSLALEMLCRATTKQGARGMISSIRTANRIGNLRDRIDRIVLGDECPKCNHATQNRLRWEWAPRGVCECDKALPAHRELLKRMGKAGACHADVHTKPDASEAYRVNFNTETDKGNQ